MMVLSGIIAAGAKYALTKAARSRAEAEIATMETALENFKADNGFYPVSSTSRASTPPGTPTAIEYYNSTNLFTALAGLQPGTKAYMTFKSNQKRIETLSGKKNTYIVDPFGSPYNYYRAGMSPTYIATNSVTFDLWSYGPDGKNNTADDITNWKH